MKQTHDEMIAVIQAHKDGKTIQAQNINGDWIDAEPPQFDFGTTPYRVKPQPREWWLVKTKDAAEACQQCGPFRTRAEAERSRDIGHSSSTAEIIHVREVLE